ncbi:MAG: MBL fold metallo-hydrolase RNA specificity domain-containing protein, partial [Clostridia bacterium]
SGHADQEWLLNFIYSFIEKPKQIFLVHGEPESQEVLKGKLEETTKIPVIIPDYGETYDVENDIATLESTIKRPSRFTNVKQEVIERLAKLKDEMNDMEDIIRNDILTSDAKDEDVVKLNLRIKELENQIVRIIEN